MRYVGFNTLHQIEEKQTSLKTNSQTYVVELKNVFHLALDKFAFYEESIRMCQTLTVSKVEKVQWAELGKTIFQISAPAVCQTFTFE